MTLTYETGPVKLGKLRAFLARWHIPECITIEKLTLLKKIKNVWRVGWEISFAKGG